MKKILILLLLFSTNGIAEVIQVPVLYVEEIYKSRVVYNEPTRNCVSREVYQQSVQGHDIFGGVIGALAGHVISRKLTGSTVNRVLGTAAGAVIGSKISNSIYSNNHNNYNNSRMVTYCNNVQNYHTQNVISWYNVTYRIHGKLKSTRLRYRPGSTIFINVHHRHYDRYTVLQ
jgi:uncharacterized protein YcfJ